MFFHHASLLILQASCLAAIALGTALADHALLGAEQVNIRLLKSGHRMALAALAGLWLSALLALWLQTQFDLQALLATPKSLLKAGALVGLAGVGALLWHFHQDTLGHAASDTRPMWRQAAQLAKACATCWAMAALVTLMKPITGSTATSAVVLMLLVTLLAAGWLASQLIANSSPLATLTQLKLSAGQASQPASPAAWATH